MCFIEEQHERNCPDEVLHGPRHAEIAFKTITSENFKSAEMETLHYSADWLKEAILSQSMKRNE
jgi:hypothetical protein